MTETPENIVARMYENDFFSQWLGIERIESGKGSSVLRMKVRKDMLNGFGLAHGGITYSLADSALAFASNSYGLKALSVETSISHFHKVYEGDVLTTHVEELSRSNKIGNYLVHIENQKQEQIALFKATVYITPKKW